MSDRLAVLRDMESPPGGWRYTVSATDLTLKAPYAKTLRGKVLAHMEANSIPVPADFEEWVEDAMCRESGHGHPFCGNPPPVPAAGRAKVLSLGVAKRFVQTLWHVAKDREFVPLEEARRRAVVCMGCPLSGEIGGCRGCGSILRKAEKVLSDYDLDIPEGKEFCMACGCYLKLKCFIDNATLDKAELVRPDYWGECWRTEKS